MSERFGFDLSMEAVRLMRREGGHWREIAREKIEGADIESRLEALAAQIDPPQPADIFLPRDQILYTDVDIKGTEADAAEIDAVMDGRTPYALEEMELDWAITAPGTARVAAIARETLDEARAFAEARGIEVRGFSSLADPDDFPRLPDFGGTGVDFLAEDDSATVGFASVRAEREMPIAAPSPEESDRPLVLEGANGPVVQVDDREPVLQVAKPSLPPLDPGPPLPRQRSEPRVFTDVDADSAGKRAASLTSPASVTVRRKDRAVPTPALAIVAAALSVGIALIIWSILPSAPRPETDTGAIEQTEEAVPETVAETPDAPVEQLPPTVVLTTPKLTLPTETVAETTRPALTFAPKLVFPASLPLDELGPFDTDALPIVSALDARPNWLEGLEELAPQNFPPESLPSTVDALDISLATPAGAVPRHDAALLTIDPEADDLPLRGAAPAAPSQPTEEDSIVAALNSQPSDPDVATPETVSMAVPENVPIAPSPESTVAEEAVPTVIQPELPKPTELALGLPDRAPRARPNGWTAEIERQKFGGRTRAELARIRPGQRPPSAQIAAVIERASRAATDLAVNTSPAPRSKPNDFDALVATIQLRLRQEREATQLAALTPDTSAAIEAALADDIAEEEAATRAQNSPRLAIPTDTSVAQRATFEDAIRLNQVNLVGVFGLPSDRRALIRLPSGRFVKLKVGDKIDGGTIAAITDTKLQYRKGNRTLELSIPAG